MLPKSCQSYQQMARGQKHETEPDRKELQLRRFIPYSQKIRWKNSSLPLYCKTRTWEQDHAICSDHTLATLEHNSTILFDVSQKLLQFIKFQIALMIYLLPDIIKHSKQFQSQLQQFFEQLMLKHILKPSKIETTMNCSIGRNSFDQTQLYCTGLNKTRQRFEQDVENISEVSLYFLCCLLKNQHLGTKMVWPIYIIEKK